MVYAVIFSVTLCHQLIDSQRQTDGRLYWCKWPRKYLNNPKMTSMTHDTGCNIVWRTKAESCCNQLQRKTPNQTTIISVIIIMIIINNNDSSNTLPGNILSWLLSLVLHTQGMVLLLALPWIICIWLIVNALRLSMTLLWMCMDRGTHGQMDGWKNVRLDGWTDDGLVKLTEWWCCS